MRSESAICLLGSALSVGLAVGVAGCFDDTIRAKADAGAETESDSGTPSTSLVPAGAVVGGSRTIAGTTVNTWALLDDSKKVTEVGWALPLAVINQISSAVDYREPITMPSVVTEQTGWYGTTIDYLPRGHAPPGVYDTPHWEFHVFYTKESDFISIDCKNPALPPDDTLPDNFAIIPPPDNCSPGMGIHAFDVLSPEFNQERFTKSHTLSYYNGTLAALEPKMTKEVLLSRRTFTFDVPKVKKILSGKLYPAKFVARYEPEQDIYQITYSEFSPMP